MCPFAAYLQQYQRSLCLHPVSKLLLSCFYNCVQINYHKKEKYLKLDNYLRGILDTIQLYVNYLYWIGIFDAI